MRSTNGWTLTMVVAALTAISSLSAQAQLNRQKPRKATGVDIKTQASQRVRLPFISDVRVVPSASNAVLSFKSSQRTLPLVEIGRVPPAPDRFGVLAFPLGTSLFTRFLRPQDGRYTLNFNETNQQLEAGTTYYYIINVFNDNQNDPTRKREQETGEISTFSQTVTVVWEKILIIDDSDELSSGEITLWFWMNYGWPGAKAFMIKGLANNSASSGTSYGIDSNSVQVIENAPNDLSLSVSALEDDAVSLGGIFGSGVARGTAIGPPLDGPAKDSNSEYNVARGTFDLTAFPSEVGQTRSQQFKLVSLPNGGYLGRLSFEVYGYFEITRRVR